MIDDLKSLSLLVDQGLALIPVDDEKQPFKPFKGKERLNLVELRDFILDCDRSGKTGKEGCQRVAIRTGRISGGLICIDVDSKYKDGFAERIWTDFKEMYPETFDKLVVDRTPSGGLHFYYRVPGVEIGSCDLASRKATLEELSVKPDRKTYCFLELKAGDGSLSTCFPSIGYVRLKGEKLFDLSENEHSELISLCLLYHEIEKVEPIKIKVNEKSQYKDGETPFDEFNRSGECGKVLEELGWTFYKSSGVYDRYIKPGSKKKNVGGSFNRETHNYRIFTSDTDLTQKNFNPSSLLCFGSYSGDWSRLYSDLVEKGYGKLKENVEQSVIKRSIKYGRDLPANISEAGKEKFEDEKKRFGEKWQYGIFWEEDDKGGFKISREKLYFVSKELGFRSYKEKPVYIEDRVIKKVDSRFYFDRLKAYIGNDGVSEDLKDCYEAFLQASGKFTIERLEVLDESEILKSSKVVSYKFYSNCYLYIDREGFDILSYDDTHQLVWHHDKKNREFRHLGSVKEGLYWEFIQNAIGWSQYVSKCIGYYAHDYRDEEGYWIIATEKCENPKDGGGSGKNIFCSLFELITTFKSTPASMIKFDNNLLQSWDGQRIFCLSDIPKNFKIVFFKDIVTGNAVVNKKYINEYSISIEDMCKLLGSSNYSFDKSDPGIKRRVRAVEFTDYYTKAGGVKKVTGKMFPKDWEQEDFELYDNIMVACIIEYLKGDGIIDIQEMSTGGWIKQFEQMYNHLYDFIETYIDSWVLLGRVSNASFNSDYKEFLNENNITRGLSAHTINKALEDFCKEKEIALVLRRKKPDGAEDGYSWKDGVRTVRGRLFGFEAEKEIRRIGVIEVVELVKEDLPF